MRETAMLPFNGVGWTGALRSAVLVRRATRRRLRGDAAGARALAARARAVHPGAAGPAIAEGLAALAGGDAAGAAECFGAAAAAAPSNPTPALFAAIAAIDQGDPGPARALQAEGNAVRGCYRALAGFGPGRAWPAELGSEIPAAPHLRARVLVAAEACLQERETPEAWAEGYLDVCFDVLEPPPPPPPLPDGPGTTLADAFRLFDARRWDDALATVEAVRGLPAGEAAHYRGCCLLRLARLDAAAEALAAAAAARPKDYQPVLLLGAARLLAGDPAAAGAQYERAIELFPVAGELWYHVGLARLRAGDAAAARGHFERVAGLDELIFRARLARVAGLRA